MFLCLLLNLYLLRLIIFSIGVGGGGVMSLFIVFNMLLMVTKKCFHVVLTGLFMRCTSFGDQ